MSAQAGPSRRTRNRGGPASASTVRRSADRRNPACYLIRECPTLREGSDAVGPLVRAAGR